MAQGLHRDLLARSGYTCNSACRFCCQGDWRATRGDRSDDEVHAAAAAAGRRAAAQGSGAVVLAGGEVTLREALPEWVRAARAAGARRVVVQTNGRRLAYPRYARELVDAGVDVMAIALHGHIAPLHDWLTRVPGSFEQAAHGMRNARRAGATLLVNTVVTRSNMRHLAAIAQLALDLGARGVRLLPARADGLGRVRAPSIVPNASLARPYVDEAVALVAAAGRRVSVAEGWAG